MSGQAAVAVVISIAQLLSTILTVGAKEDLEEGQKALAVSMASMGSADTSAAIFFGISTFIMVSALAAHWHLQRMPIYHEVVGSFETLAGRRLEEEEALLPAEARGVHEAAPSSPVKALQVSKGHISEDFRS